MSTIIRNGTLVTMNSRRDILRADILIEGDRIKEIGELKGYKARQEIDAAGMLVIPGLIQSHVHLCQTLFRGLADDMELMDWLKQRIWPLEAAHDEESLYDSALLASAELISGATTSIIDMGTVRHSDSLFQAVKQSGLRYLGGKCMMDCGDEVPEELIDSREKSLQESMDLFERWNGQEQGRIHYAFCPRFAVSCSEELLREVSQLSDKFNIPVHSHASENRGEIRIVKKQQGLRNILYFEQLGLCHEKAILAHCIHINEEEMKILAEKQVNVVHCPASNLKLASGLAPVPPLLDMGARVSLGADGAPCNNNLSQFMEMRLAALIHKPFYGPTSMPAEKVFEMATLGGAQAMGQEEEIGSLEPGKKADLAIVNLGHWHNQPATHSSVYSQLVYQALSSDVRATMVDGRFLMQNAALLTIDAEAVKINSEKALDRILRRAGLK